MALIPLDGPGDDTEGVVLERHAWRLQRDTPQWRVAVAIGAVLSLLVAIVPVWVLPIIEARLVTRLVALAVAFLGLQFVVGLSGQLSLCHGVFVGIGSYTTTIALSSAGWPHAVALALTPVTGFVAGIGVGLLALRIRATYLGPVTLGVAVAFPMIVKRFGWFTGGSSGLPSVDQPQPPGFLDAMAVHRWNHLIVVAVAFVAFVAVRNLITSSRGLAIRAVAANPISALASGINVRRIRVLSFAVGAALGSLGGGLLVLDSPIVGADAYDLFRSLGYYAAVVVGGVGAMAGAVFGAALFVGVPWLLESYSLRVGPNLVFGLLLIGSVTVAPGGLAVAARTALGRLLNIEDRIPDRPTGRSDAESGPAVPSDGPAAAERWAPSGRDGAGTDASD